MGTRTFKTIDNLELIIKNTQKNIIFETKPLNIRQWKFVFQFNKETFTELLNYLKDVSSKTWHDFSPREATSLSSDYAEYYDRAFDSAGFLIVNWSSNTLKVERPSLDSAELYKFSKRRMESFVYDFKRVNL